MLGVWAQFCEVIADAPGRTLGLRGRLVDVGIGVADKEGYGTGTLGSGDSGGGDRKGVLGGSIGRVVNVAEECRVVRREEGDQGEREGQYEEGEITRRGGKGESRGQIKSGHKPYLESSHDGVWTLVVRFPYPPHPLRARSAWTLPTSLLASPGLLGSWAPGLLQLVAAMRSFPILPPWPGRPLFLRTRSQHAGGGPDLAPSWVKLGPASTPN